MSRLISLITTSRADWNYALALTKAVKKSRKLKLRLIATGSHFLSEYGYSINDILSSGFVPDNKLVVRLKSTAPLSVSLSLSEYISLFAVEFNRYRPDILVLLGDRIEILAIALASLPFTIPIFHIGGGDITKGAIDDVVRHSLTKISQIHFVSSKQAFRNVLRLGEEPWRIYNTGSLVNDCIRSTRIMPISEIAKKINFISKNNYLLVTQHPETLFLSKAQQCIDNLLSALRQIGLPVIFTYPNTEPTNEIIIKKINDFVLQRKESFIIKNAGTSLYYSLVKYSSAVVGNSSSGIYDTPYFGVPAVNIGDRQSGRLKAQNVIDVGCLRSDITRGIRRALSVKFRFSLKPSIKIFFGNGHAANKIVKVLEGINIDGRLLKKNLR